MNNQAERVETFQREMIRLQHRIAALEAQNLELERQVTTQSVKLPDSNGQHPHMDVSGVAVDWQPEHGMMHVAGMRAVMMWVDSTLAALMAGFQAMVGEERFRLVLQREGRRSEAGDWQFVSRYPDFRQGFAALAEVAAMSGWGKWELLTVDMEHQECRFQVWNSLEGGYQQALGVCWGSSLVGGKLAGLCSRLFGVNCWPEQTTFIAAGDACDTFVVRPSERSIEQELDNLLLGDTATRADLAVALQRLQMELAERKQMEEQVRQSEERFRLFLEHTDDLITEVDANGILTYVNQTVGNLLGYAPSACIGQPAFMLIHPEDQQHTQAAFMEWITERVAGTKFENRVVSRTGQVYHMLWTVNLLYDSDGTLTAVKSIARDITERKQAEEMQRNLVALIETSTDCIGLASPEGLSVYLNQAGCDLVGVSKDEVEGIPVMEYVLPEDRDYIQEHIFPAVLATGRWEGEFRFRHCQTGAAIPVYYTLFVVRDPATGAVKNFATVSRDIREQKRAEAERADLQEQIIATQQAALRELSTPLIPISDTVLIMPLIGTIDSGRAQQIMETLLEGVAAHRAETVIVDITGVAVVDTQVAQALVRAAQAVKLLGARVILTGIQPQIAQTIVHLGIDLSGIITRGSLQAGIAYALGR